LELAEVLKEEIEQELEDWKVVEEFEKEMSSLESKKHVGNGKNIYDLQDLLVEWQNKLKGLEKERQQ
jgi:hypothetical protein